MRVFFSPAIALMNRLGYTRKFALLGLLSLFAIAVVVYGLFASLDQVKRTSERELEGLALIKPVSQTVQLLQQHRGLSAALLDGYSAMHDRRAAKKRETTYAFNAMEGKLPSRLASSEDFRHIKAGWEHLRKEGASLSVAESFAAHTRLIDQILLFEATVSNEYGLNMDPEISAFYLIDTATDKLPDALEHLGQIRAYGTGILARGQITEQQKLDMYRLVAKLDDVLQALKVNLEKTGRHNPAIRNTLMAATKDIADSAQQIVGVVKSDILAGRLATPSEDFLMMATMAIDRCYTQIYESLLPTTEALIRERVARAEKVLYASIGIAILLFLIAAYFAAGIYCAIIGSIRSLAHSAHAFAGGDMRVRANLGTRDELSQIGDSFNEMADGFSTLLAAHMRAEASLAKESHKNETLLRMASDGIHILDLDGNVVQVNNAFCRMLGYTRAEMLTMNAAQWDAQWTAAQIKANIDALAGSNASMLETRHRRRDGSIIDVEVSIIKVDVDGQTLVYCSSRDVTERKRAEENIHRLAFYDPLTHLPNRRLLLDRLQHALATSAHSRRRGAVMFIDLDNFKAINDTQGHKFGDLLLIEVAQRLQSCVREGDTVARPGGDEFVVMLEDLGSGAEHAATQTEEVGEKILATLNRPYRINAHEFHCTASIGINLFIDRDTSADELLKHADIAMFQAKKAGRNAIRFFDPKMQAVLEARILLEADLRQALCAKLVRQQFRLYYQPQVDGAGRIFGAEALVRWIHPQRGTVPPFQFIPLAEESSLILDIGQWVLETASRQLASWSNDEQKCDLVLAVNVSARQFKLKDFVDRVAAVIQGHRINPSRLKLELTESMVLEDLADIVAKMHALKALGVGLSMDDFGTGYSSLSYLKQLPLDQLKIDRSFINDIVTDPLDAVMVRTIIDMAHNFGLDVIAEGVETEAQLAFLKEHGCMAYQGYLFSKPVPIEEFEALMPTHLPIVESSA